MKLFRNLKLSTKILSGFFMVIIISIIIGITGILSLNAVKEKDTNLYAKMTVPFNNLYNMTESYQRSRANLRDLILSSTPSEIIEYESRIKQRNSDYNNNLDEFKKTLISNEGQQVINTLVASMTTYDKIESQIIGLAKENKDEQALELLKNEAEKARTDVEKNLKALTDLKIQLAKKTSEDNISTANSARNLMIGFISFGVIFALVLGIIISKSITKPISKLVDYADRLALGDIDIDIKVSSKDEVGILMSSFKKMTENIKENAQAAEMIAKGNLNLNITEKSDKDVLGKSIKLVIDTLNKLENEINKLTQAAVNGNLSLRGNMEAFNGGYKSIVEGINSTLDAIIEPIAEASNVLKEISNGNLHIHVEGNYKGDHAEIKNALNTTIDSLSVYINDISFILNEMSNSNLNLEINNEYKGDFLHIKNALTLIVKSFNEVFREINNSADQVAAGSNQVSIGSQALSQGTTEQASSIEQLTASITEIAAQTKQNAVNASQANDISLNAKNAAIQGNIHMKEMLESMYEINESSSNISNIIKVIDDIAFQTNILALNAAVEAARAGQHGKGFAVVAEEVRNLAARSANAAKETTVLIEGSIKKVESGTKIANSTAESLDEIVKSITTAATLVGEIASASNEQATAIAQINKGIEEVSSVVQTNSSTAEESAAASEELSSQASLLKSMIAQFKLSTNSSNYRSNNNIINEANHNIMKDNHNYSQSTQIKLNKPRIILSDTEFGKY